MPNHLDLLSHPFMHLPGPPVTQIQVVRHSRKAIDNDRELLFVSPEAHSFEEVESYVRLLQKDLDDILGKAKREYERPLPSRRGR